MLVARVVRGGQFGCSHPVSLSGEDSCFVVSQELGRFAHWTNISVDISPVGEAPSWLTTSPIQAPQSHSQASSQRVRARVLLILVQWADLPPD